MGWMRLSSGLMITAESRKVVLCFFFDPPDLEWDMEGFCLLNYHVLPLNEFAVRHLRPCFKSCL